jgi:hypothetical protein
MHRTRKPDDRTTRPLKKLDLRRETLRRLDTLSDADLQQAVGGMPTSTRKPSIIVTTAPNEGC